MEGGKKGGRERWRERDRVYQGMYAEVKEHHHGLCSLLSLLCEFQGSDLGYRAFIAGHFSNFFCKTV